MREDQSCMVRSDVFWHIESADLSREKSISAGCCQSLSHENYLKPSHIPVNGGDEVPSSFKRRDRPDDVNVDVAKSVGGLVEYFNTEFSVPHNLAVLTGDARPCLLPGVTTDDVPDKLLLHHFGGCKS